MIIILNLIRKNRTFIMKDVNAYKRKRIEAGMMRLEQLQGATRVPKGENATQAQVYGSEAWKRY